MALSNLFCELEMKKKVENDSALESDHTLWGVYPIAMRSQQDYLQFHEARPAKEHRLVKRKTS